MNRPEKNWKNWKKNKKNKKKIIGIPRPGADYVAPGKKWMVRRRRRRRRRRKRRRLVFPRPGADYVAPGKKDKKYKCCPKICQKFVPKFVKSLSVVVKNLGRGPVKMKMKKKIGGS
jgi:hypothetical protein